MSLRMYDEGDAGGGASSAPVQDTPAAPPPEAGAGGGAGTEGGAGITSPAAPPPPASVFDRAAKLGLDLRGKYKDEDSAYEGLFHAARHIGKRDADAEYGRQMRAYEPQIRQILEQRQQQAQQQQGQAPQKQEFWKPPEFNEALMRMVELDEETGRYRPKAGAPSTAADKVNAYVDYMRTWQHEFATNPQEKLKPFIEDVRQQVLKEVQGTLHEQQRQQQWYQTADQLMADRARMLFEFGPDGTPLRDLNNKYVMSQVGMLYHQALQEAADKGYADPRDQDRFAMGTLMIQSLAHQAAQKKSPKPKPGATRAPNTGSGESPSPNRPDQSSGKKMTLAEKLKKNVEAAGITRIED